MNPPTERLHHGFDHRWHVAINCHATAVGHDEMRWMYAAKSMADEVPRLALLFGIERRGELAKRHHQCSRDQAGEEVPNNHLTCCLGVKCAECPHLAALEAAELSADEKDTAKAWTCAAHIVHSGGDPAGEGFVLTVDDQMFWRNLYTSLAGGPDGGG